MKIKTNIGFSGIRCASTRKLEFYNDDMKQLIFKVFYDVRQINLIITMQQSIFFILLMGYFIYCLLHMISIILFSSCGKHHILAIVNQVLLLCNFFVMIYQSLVLLCIRG